MVTNLGSYSFTPVNGTWYTIEFEVVNDSNGHPSLRFWIYLQSDTKPLMPSLQITDIADTVTTAGYVALGSHSTSFIYDNFSLSTGDPVSLPAAPASVVADSSSGGNQITFSWAVPNDGNSPISDYIVEYKLTTGSSWTTYNDGVSTVPSATVSGLTNATSYDFRVSAVIKPLCTGSA